MPSCTHKSTKVLFFDINTVSYRFSCCQATSSAASCILARVSELYPSAASAPVIIDIALNTTTNVLPRTILCIESPCPSAPSRQPGRLIGREHREPRPAYSPKVLYSAGRPTLGPSACVHRTMRVTPHDQDRSDEETHKSADQKCHQRNDRTHVVHSNSISTATFPCHVGFNSKSKNWLISTSFHSWSGREDSNLRPLPPEDSALPG